MHLVWEKTGHRYAEYAQWGLLLGAVLLMERLNPEGLVKQKGDLDWPRDLGQWTWVAQYGGIINSLWDSQQL